MIIGNKSKIVRSIRYTLTNEEIQALRTSAKIVDNLFKNEIFDLGDDWNVVDYPDVVDFLNLISKHSGEEFTIED